MVVGAKACELTDGFLWFVYGLYVGILTSPLKSIVYIHHFGLYRKSVSLICSLCLCVMVLPLYRQHTPALYGVQ